MLVGISLLLLFALTLPAEQLPAVATKQSAKNAVPAAKPQPAGLTVGGVVSMVEAGLSDDLIIAKPSGATPAAGQDATGDPNNPMTPQVKPRDNYREVQRLGQFFRFRRAGHDAFQKRVHPRRTLPGDCRELDAG